MSDIIVFGAGGTLGRLVIAEARARDLTVTAAVREPARHAGLAGEGVAIAAADVLDAAAVAAAAGGHGAAIASLYQERIPHDVFYAGSARALLEGLAAAGVPRLVTVGSTVNLETAPGVRIMDGPAFPAEHLPFAFGHTAALHVLRAAPAGGVDWAMLTPPMAFPADGPRTGAYRLGGDALLVGPGGEPAGLSYADLAVALVDEARAPTVHRARAAVVA
jgi:putative NADH-flavin reductase